CGGVGWKPRDTPSLNQHFRASSLAVHVPGQQKLSQRPRSLRHRKADGERPVSSATQVSPSSHPLSDTRQSCPLVEQTPSTHPPDLQPSEQRFGGRVGPPSTPFVCVQVQRSPWSWFTCRYGAWKSITGARSHASV